MVAGLLLLADHGTSLSFKRRSFAANIILHHRLHCAFTTHTLTSCATVVVVLADDTMPFTQALPEGKSD